MRQDKKHDFKILEKFCSAIKNSNEEIENAMKTPVFKEIAHAVSHEARHQRKLNLEM